MPPLRESLLAQRQVHPDREHEHRKTDFPEERDRAVGWVDKVENGGPNEDASDDLSDHDRHEAVTHDPE